VLFASAADEAIVFRRGPSNWYHLVRWDTAHDKFEHGAWLRGRIYEDKCDLSPDGRLLLYFVHQGRKARSSYTDAWTGVSRSPWLAALALWPHGATYGGGGRFTGLRHVMLRHSPQAAHRDHPPQGLNVMFGDAPLQGLDRPAAEETEWSGVDQKGRRVFAEAGRLYRRTTRGVTELIDLRGLEPNPQPAPAWALRPLVRV
jgi:hypothetical protein